MNVGKVVGNVQGNVQGNVGQVVGNVVGQGGGGVATPIGDGTDIEDLAKYLDTFFSENLSHVTAKLSYDDLQPYLKEYNILTNVHRQALQEMKSTEQINYFMERMKRRTDAEWILLAMALINSDQGHIFSPNRFQKEKLEAVNHLFKKCLDERKGNMPR